MPPGVGAQSLNHWTTREFHPFVLHVRILRLNKQPNSAFTSLARTGSYVPVSNHFDLRFVQWNSRATHQFGGGSLVAESCLTLATPWTVSHHVLSSWSIQLQSKAVPSENGTELSLLRH